ncbi:MAG: Gfo/Idh/MocA family oxidoreductase [Oscillospiraceae bacterium]|nr:Gfo/Idh/MocA family oxidoreductase [Oscillospiraceae bacterium]
MLENEKIYIAVIGCGTIANAAHIPSYKNNAKAEILYFCDIIPERAQKAAKEYTQGGAKAITDYREALGDPKVDAVSICAPNNTHAQISIDALNAGKQVLCEKPSARTYEEAKKMQEAQKKTGNMLSIGVVNRFNSKVRKIREIIDSGELGEIYHVYVSFRAERSIPGLGGAFTTKEIAGGGVLIDWGVHYLDIVMYCLNDPEVKTVSGKNFCKLAKNMREYQYTDMWAGPPDYNGVYDVDDFVTGFIRTSGSTITLNGAWAQNIGVSETYIDFIGTKSGIRLDYWGDFDLYKIKDGKLESVEVSYEKWDFFQKEIDSFVDTVKTKEKLPSNIDAAIITTRMMQALYDSSEQDREIVLS